MAAQAELTQIDAKNGLRQVGEALSFLHAQAKMYHCAVEPHHVYLTPSGDWKLGSASVLISAAHFFLWSNFSSYKLVCRNAGGMSFATQVGGRGESVAVNPHVVIGANPDAFICPALEYCAPEIFNKVAYNHTVDSFSLGALAWRLHRFLSKQAPVSSIVDSATFQTYVLIKLFLPSF